MTDLGSVLVVITLLLAPLGPLGDHTDPNDPMANPGFVDDPFANDGVDPNDPTFDDFYYDENYDPINAGSPSDPFYDPYADPSLFPDDSLAFSDEVESSAADQSVADLQPKTTSEITEEPVTSDNDWVLETIGLLLNKINRLAETEAFTASDSIDEIRLGIATESLDRLALIDEARKADEAAADQLELLDEQGREISDELRAALTLLSRPTIDKILAVEVGLLESRTLLDGLTDLALRNGRAPTGERVPEDRLSVTTLLTRLDPETGELGLNDLATIRVAQIKATTVLGTTLGAPIFRPVEGSVAPATESEAIDDPVEENPAVAVSDDVDPPTAVLANEPSRTTSVAVLIGLASLVLFGAVALLMSRRRKASFVQEPEPQTSADLDPDAIASTGLVDLLDTSRRMTAALDGAAVRQIAVADSVRLCSAEAGAFLRIDGEALEFVEAIQPDFFRGGSLKGSALARVIETGQATCAVSDDDPAVAHLPMALAAVPVIANGGVTGAIVVLRSAARPFGATDLERLNMLAPVAGSALVAAATHRSVVGEADIDGLTQLKNRRCLDRDLAALTARPLQGGELVGFAMIDVDHFKNFNDTNGHRAGDVALQTIAQQLANNVRSTDVVYRYGGEEFSILFAGAPAGEVEAILERIRGAIEASSIAGMENQPLGKVTISTGYILAEPSNGRLPERADKALYEAKHRGRNQVVAAH